MVHHTSTHYFNGHFPGKHQLASLILDASSQLVPTLSIPLGKAKILHIFLHTIPPGLPQMSPMLSKFPSILITVHPLIQPTSSLHSTHLNWLDLLILITKMIGSKPNNFLSSVFLSFLSLQIYTST